MAKKNNLTTIVPPSDPTSRRILRAVTHFISVFNAALVQLQETLVNIGEDEIKREEDGAHRHFGR